MVAKSGLKIRQCEIQDLLENSNKFLKGTRKNKNDSTGPAASDTPTLQPSSVDRLTASFAELSSRHSSHTRATRAKIGKTLNKNPTSSAQLGIAVSLYKRKTFRPSLLDDEYLANLAVGVLVPGIHYRIDTEVQTTVAVLRATFLKFGPKHRHYTRLATASHSITYLKARQRQDFNRRFRRLPKELREIIFGLSFEYDGKKMPQMIVSLRPDRELYQNALRSFYLESTFLFNSKRISALPILGNCDMGPAAWNQIRSLVIRHDFIQPGQGQGFRHFGTDEISPFTPCRRCDFEAIQLATHVRVLHLDFGDSPPSILETVQCICRLAVTKMLRIQRLTLTLSNIRCPDGVESVENLISASNDAMRIPGRLLAVDTRHFGPGQDKPDFAPESWFWQAEPKQWLVWIDHLNRGDEAAVSLARFATCDI